MTVLSRGARVRRGGRRPGWALLTVLLVLAMGASSALIFTNRVELLRLAVLLALWAAVAGAFVSVLYRRKSDADQARERDLKLVYDLQLDREISARREYELTVESQLRRELASELRAQASDDVAALRAELTALRTRLEILFDTDLANRPALETQESELAAIRAYNDWEFNGESTPVDWVSSDRVTSVRPDSPRGRNSSRPDEASIIDVPEEPLSPPRPPTLQQPPQPPPQPMPPPQPTPQVRERVRLRHDVLPQVPPQVPPEATPVIHAPEPQPRFGPRHRPPPPVSVPPAAGGPTPPAGPIPPPAQPGPPPSGQPLVPPSGQPLSAVWAVTAVGARDAARATAHSAPTAPAGTAARTATATAGAGAG